METTSITPILSQEVMGQKTSIQSSTTETDKLVFEQMLGEQLEDEDEKEEVNGLEQGSTFEMVARPNQMEVQEEQLMAEFFSLPYDIQQQYGEVQPPQGPLVSEIVETQTGIQTMGAIDGLSLAELEKLGFESLETKVQVELDLQNKGLSYPKVEMGITESLQVEKVSTTSINKMTTISLDGETPLDLTVEEPNQLTKGVTKFDLLNRIVSNSQTSEELAQGVSVENEAMTTVVSPTNGAVLQHSGMESLDSMGTKHLSNVNWENQADIFDQIIREASVLKEEEMTTLKLKLAPRVLGEIQIDLAMRDGKIMGKIWVEQAGVQNIVEQAMQEFQTNSNSSYSFEQVTVDVQTNQGQSSHQSQPETVEGYLEERMEEEEFEIDETGGLMNLIRLGKVNLVL